MTPEKYREKFGIQDSNPSSRTPVENNLKLVTATESVTLVDERLYRSLVGSLLHTAKQTRPNIVWIFNVLSRFMNQPTNTWACRQTCSPLSSSKKVTQIGLPARLTFTYTENAMQTGAEITMTGDQQQATFSRVVSDGEQLAGKPTGSRLWLSHPAKLRIRAWKQLCKRRPSCVSSSAIWAIRRSGNTQW